MQKRTLMNRVCKATQQATSHIYRDDDWSGVMALKETILKALPQGSTFTIEEARYEGAMGEPGHRKVFYGGIRHENNHVGLQIIASFCGTMADPMGAYDLTLIMC